MKKTILLISMLILIAGIVSAAGTVTRTFSKTTVNANEEFTVTYTPSGWSTYDDHFWQIVQPLPGSGWKVDGTQKTDINYFIMNEQNPKIYTLTAPSTAGTYNFEGRYAVDAPTLSNFDSTSIVVGGGNVGTKGETNWTTFIIIGVAVLIGTTMLKGKK